MDNGSVLIQEQEEVYMYMVWLQINFLHEECHNSNKIKSWDIVKFWLLFYWIFIS